MSLKFTFVRHGRSEANEANLWQGQGNSPLSADGRRQVAAAASRLADREFDLVVASDLDRARDTAAAVGRPFETDPAFREMHLGDWEGRPFEDVAAEHPDLLQAIRDGEAIRFGGFGESVIDFESRISAAVDRLAARVGSGSVLVATHGGVIDAVVGRHLGRVPGRRTFPISTNTSLTTLVGDPGRMRLARFNDAVHLGVDVGFLGRMRSAGIPVIGFVRHGITEANKLGKIQGQSCWGLADEGVLQSTQFASWYPRPDRVVSSPSSRAMETARVFDRPIEEETAVMEMSFGDWEGRYTRDVRSTDLGRRVFEIGEDLPRGGNGETFAELVDRMCRFLGRIELDPAHRTVVVSHGAAIRAVLAGIHQRGNDINRDIGVATNTSVTHVALTPQGPVVVDYAVAPHMEDHL